MNDLSISKRILWRYVNKKINRTIHHFHVFGVITILFEEIVKDLKNGKDIKIFNFGTFSLKTNKPRRYHDVRFNQVMLSKERNMISFSLAPRVRKIICKYLDLDKTFSNHDI